MATNFKLWLDTAAPAMGSMSLNKNVGNSTSLTLTQSITDLTKGVGSIYMKVWADTEQSPSTTSSNIPTSWSTYSDTVSVSGIVSESGVSKQYYVHAMYMDSVGNVSDIFTESTGYRYCTKKPTITVDSSTSTKVVASGTTTVKYTATSFDTFSTVTTQVYNTTTSKYLLTSSSKSTGVITVTKTFETGLYKPGNNVIRITVTDKAGNTTTKDITILYDSQETTGTLFFGASASDTTIKSCYNSSYSAFYLYLKTSATDIVSIKLTVAGGSYTYSSTYQFSNLTSKGSNNYYITSLNISDQSIPNGQYTISGTYTDNAGVTGNLTSSTVFLDTVAPSLTDVTGNSNTWYTSGSKHYPSPHSITFKVSDPSPSYGMDNLTLGSNFIVKNGDTSVSDKYSLSKNSSSGVYTLQCNDVFTSTSLSRTITISDKAGNTTTALTLKSPTWDATGPTISATISDSVVTLNTKEHLASTTTPVKSLTVSDTGAGISSVAITWTQSSSQPTSWTSITGTSGNYTTSVNSKWASTNADGTWYLWVKAIDNVGNTTIQNKLIFVYDKTAPTGSISWGKTYTTTRQNTVTISATDTPTNAGVKMKVTSASITDGDTGWVAYTTSRTITFKPTELSGNKTVSVQFKDAVGNVSTTYSATIEYESDVSPTVVIMNNSGSTAQGSYTKVLPFSVRIGMSNDDISVCKRFQLYGDFSKTNESTATTASGTWTTFTADSGKNYMTVSGLYFSKNDGVKTVSLLMENTAGVSYAIVSDTITLDRTPPQITVSNLSHNIISVQNVDREGDTHSPKCKANTVTFDFVPNERLSAYKVCVINPTNYADTEASSTSAIAIGTSNGSLNMTGGTVEASTTVTCTIKGADLQAHSIVNNKDGAYIVGVFGQDVAGVWSLMGTIAT